MPESDLPVGPQWHYEPKWDGFRCLAFRDGAHVDLESKSQKPLTRYFPELAAALLHLRARSVSYWMERSLYPPMAAFLSIDLLMRIHPAESRVLKLSKETPVRIYRLRSCWWTSGGRSLVERPLEERRKDLERFAKAYFPRESRSHHPAFSGDRQTLPSRANGSIWASGSTESSPSGTICLTKPASAPGCRKSRSGARRIASWADFVIWRRSRSLARCCWVYTTKKVFSITWDSRSSIHREDRAALTKKLEGHDQAAGVHGQSAGRLEPLEHEAVDGMAAACAETRGRGASSIISRADGFGTGRNSCAGVRKKRHGIAHEAGEAGEPLGAEVALKCGSVIWERQPRESLLPLVARVDAQPLTSAGERLCG